jgi:hypothetical protein
MVSFDPSIHTLASGLGSRIVREFPLTAECPLCLLLHPLHKRLQPLGEVLSCVFIDQVAILVELGFVVVHEDFGFGHDDGLQGLEVLAEVVLGAAGAVERACACA